MVTTGTVREWHPDDGWGLIDSDETPGGCWVHFSAIRGSGYKSLTEGRSVQLEHEAAEQDGFSFRAVAVWPDGSEPFEEEPEDGPSAAYRSTLRITWDDPS